jgi:hypothetical protein
MAADVITLPRRDGGEVVWVCGCGSTTHYHHGDGRVVCGSCETEASAANGDWRLRFPDAPADPKPLDSANFKIAAFGTAEVFFKRQIKFAAADRPIAAVVVFFEDGSLSSWASEALAEGRAWLAAALDKAKARLTA